VGNHPGGHDRDARRGRPTAQRGAEAGRGTGDHRHIIHAVQLIICI
jgi:hypothetical protein